MISDTSSPIYGMKVFMPKSERLSLPVAEKPAACYLSEARRPALLNVTCSVTGLVTPSNVRLPVMAPV
jgi:hypothetical protein